MKRVVNILNLLEKDEYVTSEHLALGLQVSNKTVRNELKNLMELCEENGFIIVSKPRYGYRLDIKDNNKYLAFKSSHDETELSIVNADRIPYITMELLISNSYQSLVKLTDKIYVSKSTMYILMKKVESILNEYSLKLDNKNSRGIKVIGNEFDIRHCICDLLIRSNLNKHYRVFKDDNKVEAISAKFSSLLQKYNIILNEIAYHNFLVYLFVAIYRKERGNILPSNNIEKHSFDIPEKRIIEDLELMIRNRFNMQFEDEEKIALVYKLMGVKNSTDFDSNDYGIYVNEDVNQLAVDMVKLIDKEFELKLSSNFDLRMGLTRHLTPMVIRIKYAITLKNPLLDRIKKQYTLAYFMAERACLLLEERCKKKVSEDEIAYVALILRLALEQEKNENKEKKNIVLVCGSSTGSAHLLMYKFQKEFKEYLNEISISNVLDLETMDLVNVDYVFTTVPIMKKVAVPIIHVGYFLDDNDVLNIKKVFNQSRMNILKDFYSEDQFVGNLKANNKEEVLSHIFQMAKKKYNLTKEYYESVVTRELLARTSFGNLVAMPHTVEIISKDQFVYLAILEKPILWDEQKVQVIFLTNVGKKRGDTLTKFYDLTMRFIMDKQLVKKLIENPTFEYFMSIINSLEEH